MHRAAQVLVPRHVDTRLTWVIVGGESGPGARPCEVDWIRDLVQQCQRGGIACFVKQLGRWPLVRHVDPTGLHGDALVEAATEPFREWPDGSRFGNPTGVPSLNGRVPCLRDKKGGDMKEWPEAFRVRQYPGVS